jgi:hypothetical protein
LAVDVSVEGRRAETAKEMLSIVAGRRPEWVKELKEWVDLYGCVTGRIVRVDDWKKGKFVMIMQDGEGPPIPTATYIVEAHNLIVERHLVEHVWGSHGQRDFHEAVNVWIREFPAWMRMKVITKGTESLYDYDTLLVFRDPHTIECYILHG